MDDQFQVPEVFKHFSDTLFKKETITEREFIDFCFQAILYVESNWEMREGICYHVAGAWIHYKKISEDDLLDRIGQEFAELEDDRAPGPGFSQEKWDNLRNLVIEASEKYPTKG